MKRDPKARHLPYGTSLALLTDLYELTMAYGFWKAGRAGQEVVFHHFFRSLPFGGGYCVAAGLGPVLEILSDFRFERSDLAYLATLRGADGSPLFEAAFLEDLEGFRFECDLDAVPEGTVVFPHEPLVRVRGPLLQAQLIETLLLNLINFQTLIATKAARVVEAAAGDPVIEFGLRRAQGIDGGLSASRAAYIGGCAGTSNTLAGKLYGIPVRGTHAHSWTMSFPSEPEAFAAYARAMPNNSIFLVDTYDSLTGVRNAIEAGRRLAAAGHRLLGIRLDSGDLAWLSQEARRLLDEAGFPDAVIVASNELDETIIESLKRQGARIGIWGVGTKLATGHGQGALGGVYKLSAVRDEQGRWERKLKLSEQPAKVNNPGLLGVRRFRDPEGRPLADAIYDIEDHAAGPWTLVDPEAPIRRRAVEDPAAGRDLLEPVMRGGRRVDGDPDLGTIRARARRERESFPPGVRRFVNPHAYPVGLESRLYARRLRLMEAERRRVDLPVA